MAVPVSSVPRIDGAPPVFAAPSASDTAQIGGTLIVKNGSGASITVTMIAPGNLATGDPFPDKAYPVAAGAERWIPVLSEYRDPNTGMASVTFSAVASVTAAVVNHS